MGDSGSLLSGREKLTAARDPLVRRVLRAAAATLGRGPQHSLACKKAPGNPAYPRSKPPWQVDAMAEWGKICGTSLSTKVRVPQGAEPFASSQNVFIFLKSAQFERNTVHHVTNKL